MIGERCLPIISFLLVIFTQYKSLKRYTIWVTVMGIDVKKKKNKSCVLNTESEEGDNEDIKPPFINHLNKTAKQFVKETDKPLLIMYYCDTNGMIFRPDIEMLFSKLCTIGKPAEELNVILHTNGGHPNTAYLLVQTIRKFTKKINLFIPEHAYSGGTLMALGANQIYMGPYASLGPIDLQVQEDKYKGALLNMEKYVEFVKYTTEEIFGNSFSSQEKAVISKDLLLELTKELSPTKIGSLFRLRKLSEYYGRILASDYMFKDDDNRKLIVDRIIKRLNSENPDHSFDIDFHIAQAMMLKVALIPPNLFSLAESFIKLCDLCKNNGEICRFVSRDKMQENRKDFRVPFFEVYLPTKEKEVSENE